MTQTSTLTINNHVAWLRLNRPEVRNAFDDALIQELTQHLNSVRELPELRALVLAAEGAHFSAGADLNWMQRMIDVSHAENKQDALRLAGLMEALDTLPMPVIACVQGAAYGGAIGLISCCDIVLATQDACFALSEVRLGLAPATIAPYVMAAIGKRSCRQLFLTAETFDASDAKRFGLVSEVVQAQELDQRLELYLQRIFETAPQASRAAKALLRAIDPDAEKSHYHEYTSELIAELRCSDEGQAGLAAFLNKQPLPWTDKP